MRNRVNALEGHYLLCGHGRVGRIVAEELERHRVAFVIVELAEEAVADRIARGENVIVGDATDEKVLESAGVRRAKGLVSALQSDADNLYVTLTAREMNPSIRIVARATDDAAAAKLKRAGADRTISPNVIGGREMAQHLLMPAVVDFIHLATGKQNLELEMREIHVRDGSRLCGVPFSESPIRREHGVIVVAINRSSGESVFNPDSSFVVGANDILICLGRPEHLAAMQKLAEQGVELTRFSSGSSPIFSKDLLDELANGAAAAPAFQNEVGPRADVRRSIGGAGAESAGVEQADVGRIVAAGGGLVLRQFPAGEVRARGGVLVLDSLLDGPDSQLAGPVLDGRRNPSGNPGDLQPGGDRHLDPVAILRVEDLQLVSAPVEVHAPVGQDTVHVEEESANPQNSPTPQRSWRWRAPVSLPSPFVTKSDVIFASSMR